MQTVILLGVLAILIMVLVELVESRKRQEASKYLQSSIPMTDKEIKMQIQINRLIAENVALENKTFFGM